MHRHIIVSLLSDFIQLYVSVPLYAVSMLRTDIVVPCNYPWFVPLYTRQPVGDLIVRTRTNVKPWMLASSSHHAVHTAQ